MMTDEMVTPGHPDKIADKISDALLNIALKENKETKVAVETFITGTKDKGLVVVGGEMSMMPSKVVSTVREVLKRLLAKKILVQEIRE